MLRPYLAVYVKFSRCALFTKATPTNISICHDFNCHINERETPKTCLTNHKSFISHHITPLVINSLGGGHTHTCILTSRTKAISRNQLHASLWPAHAWFNKIICTQMVMHCSTIQGYGINQVNTVCRGEYPTPI